MLIYIIAFVVILSVLVFVHEFGHYFVARRCGVAIDAFSIGFGRELFGVTDRAGTRWKFCLIPLGGYVKFFGDANAASAPDPAMASSLTEAERARSFHHKSLPRRAAIVAAGPVANFLFAIVLLAGLFMTVGQPYTPPVVSELEEGSPAAEAGLRPGDRFVAIDGEEIDRFEDLQQIVRLNRGTAIDVVVARQGAGQRQLTITPDIREVTDQAGNTHEIGYLGVRAQGRETRRYGPLAAVWAGAEQTYELTAATLQAVGQIVTGQRTAEELGGPVRIAQMSGEVAQVGLVSVIWFMALLSVNLGLINFFPVPMLDGGHLLIYLYEAVRGRPLPERVQEYAFRIGLALVLTLLIFVTWNDLARLEIIDFVSAFGG